MFFCLGSFSQHMNHRYKYCRPYQTEVAAAAAAAAAADVNRLNDENPNMIMEDDELIEDEDLEDKQQHIQNEVDEEEEEEDSNQQNEINNATINE